MGVPITIWSGFVHQGMAALFVALKHIEKLFADGVSLDGYKLILEGDEDFSIHNEDQFLEVHQVKAYRNSSKASNYENARASLASFSHVPGKYLHTMSLVEDWENRDDGVQLFEYPGDQKGFCDKLPQFQKDLLNSHHWVQNGASGESGYYVANHKLSLMVCKTHFERPNDTFHCSIPFNTIKDWATSMLPYPFAGMVWKSMWKGLTEFLEKCYRDNSIEEFHAKYIVDFVEVLGSYSESQMDRFLRNVNPNIKLDENGNTAIQLFAVDKWKSGFLKILHRIKLHRVQDSLHQVPFFVKDEAWWVPTMIIDDGEDVVEDIRKNIDGALLIYFEATNLITKSFDWPNDDSPDPIIGKNIAIQDWLDTTQWEAMGMLNNAGDGLLDTELKRIYSIKNAARILNNENDT